MEPWLKKYVKIRHWQPIRKKDFNVLLSLYDKLYEQPSQTQCYLNKDIKHLHVSTWKNVKMDC